VVSLGRGVRTGLEYGGMRLTNVAQMALPAGRLHGYVLRTDGRPGRALPVSFDQGRHVGEGPRPGSWMAVSFRMPSVVDRADLATAWEAVVARHGTLRTAFALGPSGDVRVEEVDVLGGEWVEHPVADGVHVRDVLREVFDAACSPLERPSHRLCVVEADGERPVVVVGADHSHVDMWSLLVLVRDLLSGLDDLADGRPPLADAPEVAAFSDHTAVLAAMPPAPPEVSQRWAAILGASGGAMPVFPLPLGDVAVPPPAVVEVRDVLDADEVRRFQAFAHDRGVRMIAVATSVMTRVVAEQAGGPFRAVFPVHSRYQDRWHDSVGWFITNAVIESADPDLRASAAAVTEAIRLGSHPLGPILEPHGGMRVPPGMFAVSWLDTRRLPVEVRDGLELQYVGAVMPTDGVMVWFVVNDTGLHLRCRYPDTEQSRASVGGWLDAVGDALRACGD